MWSVASSNPTLPPVAFERLRPCGGACDAAPKETWLTKQQRTEGIWGPGNRPQAKKGSPTDVSKEAATEFLRAGLAPTGGGVASQGRVARPTGFSGGERGLASGRAFVSSATALPAPVRVRTTRAGGEGGKGLPAAGVA